MIQTSRITFILYFLLSILFLFSTELQSQENRTFDGSRNNLSNLEQGSVGQQYLRFTAPAYSDGIGQVSDELPNPRNISNVLFSQSGNVADENNLSDFIWAFGQFVCHDIEYLRFDENQETFISVPQDDAFFNVDASITLNRKVYADGTGVNGISREYNNQVSTYLDGSAVYGSTEERADWLRTFEGGKLRVSAGNNLPWNTITGEQESTFDATAPFMLSKPGRSNQKLFVAGDERANENPSLIALHTVFLREHNRICEILALDHPSWDDERLYQRARKTVGACIQKITFEDWLPAFGVLVEEYNGYNSTIDPSISNEFSAAGMVFDRTLIGQRVLRVDNSGNAIDKGHLTVGSDFFYEPTTFFLDGLEPYLKGMAIQVQQRFDTKAIENVRNLDYSNDMSHSTDLIVERIYEARDRGIAGYNEVRRNLGLPPFSTFANLTNGDTEITGALSELYTSIEDVDLWVGLLAESKKEGYMMGEIVSNIIKDQFRNVRDGDRFYYQNETQVFTTSELTQIENTSLTDIIKRNTEISIIQDNVFFAEEHQDDFQDGPDLTRIHLEAAVYPNPSTSGSLTVKIHSDLNAIVDLTVVNVLGHTIHSLTRGIEIGDNFIQFNLDIQFVERGYYVLLLNSDTYNNQVRFIVE